MSCAKAWAPARRRLQNEVRPGGGQLDQHDALVRRVPAAHDEPVAFQDPGQDSHRGLRHAFHPGQVGNPLGTGPVQGSERRQ